MATKAAEKAKRNSTTPAERAQDAFDRAGRVVTKLGGRIAEAKSVVAALEADLEAATKKRDYAALNPDLPAQPAPAGDAAPDPVVDET